MQTVFFQEERLMPTESRLFDDNRRVIIIERESGIGWAAAFIVLAIAIGFGVIMFMDQQTMIEYKIEQTLQNMQDKPTTSTAARAQKRDGLSAAVDDGFNKPGKDQSSVYRPRQAASVGQKLTH